jgi:hypothetical protein
MPKVVVKGESVYKCSVCARNIRVPTNKQGLDVLLRCNITYNCQGKLRRVTQAKEINQTPAFPPEVQNVEDWFQRKVLYTHDQPVQSTTWTVKHNLANRPKLHIFVYRIVDGVNVLVDSTPLTETTIDLNTVQVTFATAESGLAQCIALASQNSTNPESTQLIVDTTTVFQVSSNVGEITLATLSASPLISLALTYKTSGTQLDVVIDYAGIDNVPAIGSPWAGTSNVVLNGKKYTVRSFNITTTPLAPAYFAAGSIPTGSTFYVSNFNGHVPVTGECLMLLGRDPYATVDRVLDRYIDVSQINTATPETFYTSGKGYTVPTLIKQTYPLILVV